VLTGFFNKKNQILLYFKYLKKLTNKLKTFANSILSRRKEQANANYDMIILSRRKEQSYILETYIKIFISFGNLCQVI
jgi:hypothetical protein